MLPLINKSKLTLQPINRDDPVRDKNVWKREQLPLPKPPKMISNPTLVLVPGNFLPPSYYSSTAKLLESHGFPTRLVTIPSTGSKSLLASNKPDIVAVRNVLEELSDSGKEIIAVAHSYGSIPTCEAVEGLGIQQRFELGKSGGVATAGVGCSMATARRREPSGYHWKVQDGSSVGKVRGELLFDVLYLLNNGLHY